MAPNKLNHRYLLVLVLVLLGSAGSISARNFDGVNPFCRTAYYRRICTQMVNGASTWLDASANAMIAARDLATRVKGLVPVLAPAVAHLEPATRDSIMKTCDENFDGIVDDLNVSLEALRGGDVGTARSHLSGALRTDCKDAMKEFGADFSALSQYAGQLSIEVDNCLAVLMQN